MICILDLDIYIQHILESKGAIVKGFHRKFQNSIRPLCSLTSSNNLFCVCFIDLRTHPRARIEASQLLRFFF